MRNYNQFLKFSLKPNKVMTCWSIKHRQNYCFVTNIFNNIKLIKLFFIVSFMAVSFEIYETNYKNKLFSKSFLAAKLIIQRYLFPVFNFDVKKDLIQNLFIFHFSDSMRIIQSSCYDLEIYICPLQFRKKSIDYFKNKIKKCIHIQR